MLLTSLLRLPPTHNRGICCPVKLTTAVTPIVAAALLCACAPAAARTAAAATVTAQSAAFRPAVTATPTGTPVQQAALPGATVPPEALAAVSTAREDLQERLGLADAEAVVVRSAEAVDWPDVSLGCPDPGKTYAQVIKSGYLVVLAVDGTAYEYHTNEGSRAVLCQDGKPAETKNSG